METFSILGKETKGNGILRSLVEVKGNTIHSRFLLKLVGNRILTLPARFVSIRFDSLTHIPRRRRSGARPQNSRLALLRLAIRINRRLQVCSLMMSLVFPFFFGQILIEFIIIEPYWNSTFSRVCCLPANWDGEFSQRLILWVWTAEIKVYLCFLCLVGMDYLIKICCLHL